MGYKWDVYILNHFIYIYIYVYIYIYICKYICKYIYIYIYVYICVYVYIYVYYTYGHRKFYTPFKKGQVADVSAIFIWTAEPAEDLSGFFFGGCTRNVINTMGNFMGILWEYHWDLMGSKPRMLVR